MVASASAMPTRYAAARRSGLAASASSMSRASVGSPKWSSQAESADGEVQPGLAVQAGGAIDSSSAFEATRLGLFAEQPATTTTNAAASARNETSRAPVASVWDDPSGAPPASARHEASREAAAVRCLARDVF